MINGTQFTSGSGGSTTSITASAPLSLSGTALSLSTNSTLTSTGGTLGVNYDNSTIVADSTTPFALKVANPNPFTNNGSTLIHYNGTNQIGMHIYF